LGEDEKAATEFVAVASSNADETLRVESRFRAAEIYDSIGWYDQAVVSYDKLEQDFPGSRYAAEAALGRTWALYHAGRHNEAEQAAATYIESHADQATVPAMKYLQANCRQKQKDYAAAHQMYQAIREQYPDSEFSARALYKIAWTHFLEGKKEEAKKTIQAFLETYPESPLKGDAGFLRGSILMAEQNFTDAHEEFRLVAEKYPDGEFGAEALFRVGECLVQLGRAEEAAGVFQAFVKRYPDHALVEDAIARRGEVKFFSASFEEAIAEFRQILDSGPDPAVEEETLYRLALTYHNMQKFKESADTFSTLLERFPKGEHTAEAKLRIGDYYLFEAEDPVKSMDLHEAALNADPDGPYSGKARFGLALARFKTNDHDGAVDVFLKLMTDHPDIKLNEQTYAWAGERLFEQGKWDQAATAFASLLRAIPDHPNPERVRLRIGECSEKAGDAQAALKHYGKVVEEAPRTESAVKANYCMARLHESLGDGEKALELYEAAANTNTGEVAALSRFRLGELFEEQEDFDAATRNYMLVAIWLLHEELSPKAHFRAAQCFEKAGKPEQAKKTYRDIVAEYPDSEQAKQAQTRLAELP
jgi:tol-pal system protein YbgF